MSPESSRHVADLIPDYVAGQLAPAQAALTRAHIDSCEACARELAAWNRLAATEQQAEMASPAPPSDMLSRIFAAITDEGMAAVQEDVGRAVPSPVAWSSGVVHGWHVLVAQARLCRRSIWVASACGIALATLYAALVGEVSLVPDILAFALPLIAATGTVFLYGPENDLGLELARATPTSARTIMLARFGLLLGFDTLLALAATLTLTLTSGDGFVALASAWFGPMALLATLSLAISLVVGTLPAVAVSATLWLSRVMGLSDGIHLSLSPDGLWQTTPQILGVALLLLLCSAFVVTRVECLPGEEGRS